MLKSYLQKLAVRGAQLFARAGRLSSTGRMDERTGGRTDGQMDRGDAALELRVRNESRTHHAKLTVKVTGENIEIARPMFRIS